MKLYVFAAFIAVSYAGRLEHLEQQQQLRAYLPPSQRSFGAAPGAHGIASGPSHPGLNDHASFPRASNQYLPPNHGSSTGSHDAVSIDSVNAHNAPSQQFGHYSASQQFGHQSASSHSGHQVAPSRSGHEAAPTHFGHHDATPQGTNSFSSQTRFQPQSAVNRQYLAPHHSYQEVPQQPFDEQTGYHY